MLIVGSDVALLLETWDSNYLFIVDDFDIPTENSIFPTRLPCKNQSTHLSNSFNLCLIWINVAFLCQSYAIYCSKAINTKMLLLS